MDVTVSIILITIALILYIQGGKAYKFYLLRQQINKIPGPTFKIPFFGISLKLLMMKKEDRIEWYRNTASQYKDGCFRSWLGTTGLVHINKPEHIEVILRSNTQITKSLTYKYLTPWLGQGLLTSSGPGWHRDRKLLTPAFHFSILEDFAEVMFDNAVIFVKCIEQEIESHGDKPFDILALSARFTLDVICETSMGVNIHAQEDIEGNYISAVCTITTEGLNRFFRPWLKPDWIFYNTATGKNFKRAVDVADDLCTRVIMKKQQTRSRTKGASMNKVVERTGTYKKKAFLDLLLEANEKEDNPLTIDEIRSQINTIIFAGYDTTSVLIAWAIFSLGNDLDVQKKVHDELDEVLGDSDNEINLKLLANLKYLDRVIKEVLRLYPSSTVVSRRLVEDMQIGDYLIPKDATMAIHIYQAHTDSSVWTDPLRFDPDRFLPENMKGRHPYAYIPFSAGPRNCLGQKYAKLEAKVALVQILRKFSVKSVDSHSTIKKYSSIVLRPVDGIYVYMTKRSSAGEKFK